MGMRSLVKYVVATIIVLGGCKENRDTLKHSSSDHQATFVEWAKKNHTTLNSMTVTADNSDLEAIFQNAGQYKVIALSEGFHNCKEMMQLHYRMIRYLVEEHGFNTVVTESGLPESRLAFDYVHGLPISGNVWKDGINKMYAHWEEGQSLIEWMREYNSSHDNELAYYGIDIGGFYNDWKTPLTTVLNYLKSVDASYAEVQKRKLGPWLEMLSEKARVKYIDELSQEDRDELALLLEEMVVYFQKNKDSFISHSGELEYQWAKQSTVAMQMAENYYRNYLNQRKGTRKYVGLNGREIAMAHNTKWVLEHRKDAKVILIDHVVHTKTETQHQDGLYGFFTPTCEILKQELGDNLFVMGMTYGGGKFWNNWQNPESRFVDTIPQSKPNGIERTMAQIGSKPYYVHWQDASNPATSWMNAIQVLRENNYFIKIKPSEWNGCVYLPHVSPGSSAN